jgi:hypothetical protein
MRVEPARGTIQRRLALVSRFGSDALSVRATQSAETRRQVHALSTTVSFGHYLWTAHLRDSNCDKWHPSPVRALAIERDLPQAAGWVTTGDCLAGVATEPTPREPRPRTAPLCAARATAGW